MKQQLEKIEALAKEELASCKEIKALDDLRVKYLGKKGGLTAILKQMGKLSAEERPVIGQLANKVRSDIEQAINEKVAVLKAEAQAEKINLILRTALKLTTIITFLRLLIFLPTTLQEILRILSI